MKKNLRYCFLFGVVLICMTSSQAQVRMSQKIDGDGAFHLKELQSILISKNDTVKILMVLPENLRPEEYRGIKVMQGDEILMMNAKRMKSIAPFKKMYNELAIGDKIKLGIRRDGQLLIESFEKIDPEKMPQGQNTMIRVGVGDGAQTEDTGEGQAVVQTFALGGEEGMRPLFGAGLILGPDNGKIKIARVLEGMSGALENADVKEGDVITAINGEKIKGIDHFFKIYDKLENKSKVELATMRNGKTLKLSFEKPAVQGKVLRQN